MPKVFFDFNYKSLSKFKTRTENVVSNYRFYASQLEKVDKKFIFFSGSVDQFAIFSASELSKFL